jgi:hypothetical protein
MPTDSKRSRSYREDGDGESGTWKRRNEVNMEKTTDALSKNQQKFVFDAEDQGFDVDYEYSGRSMFGRTCPSIQVGGMGQFATKAVVCWDNMGKGFVIYAKD